MLSRDVVIERYTEPRSIRHGDPPLVDDGSVEALHERRPPSHVKCMMLEREEIQRSRRAMQPIGVPA
jgi:hypothetical protein